jgi:GT2 family glycosyltransferase
MTSVSIIMTPFNRTPLLRNTVDSIVRQKYPNLQVIVVEDRPSEASAQVLCEQNGFLYAARRRSQEGWMNPAPLLNHAIKRATGDIVIFQNAECKYETLTGIADLVAPMIEDPTLSTSAIVQSLDEHGNFYGWYAHPRDQERAGWFSYFCQAVRRDVVTKIQGFDEIFWGYGFEDDLFEYRLKKEGVKMRHVESVLVSHQFHPRYHYTGIEVGNESLCREVIAAVENGSQPNVANYGKPWGNL